MRKPIHNEDAIIAKGQELQKRSNGEVTAWQIHQALGGRGKLSRFEEIWNTYLQSKSSKQPDVQPVLPEEAEAQIEAGLDGLRGQMHNMLTGVIANMQAQNGRQASMMARDHEIALSKKAEENLYLGRVIQELEDEVSELETALAHEHARAELAEKSLAEASAQVQKPQDPKSLPSHQKARPRDLEIAPQQ